MVNIEINGIEYEVEEGLALIQACEEAGIDIPRFCYHERLSVAGNCRMCLVDVEDSRGLSPKPVASCAVQVSEGIKIYTKTERVKNAREGVMEFLLINHPLDCPICDQGGECDLQDQAMAFGHGESRFFDDKRAVENKGMGPFIKTEMTRCIHCTRCVRFSSEVSGNHEIGAIGRGNDMEITTYLNSSVESELSGNVIDLCPVGALTSKPYAFSARPWELKKTETIDVMDALGSNIRIDSKGLKVMRVLPRLNEEINEEWITDKTRFFWDGLSFQRIDKPYKRVGKKLVKTTWDDAIDLAKKNLISNKPEEIAAISGDLVPIESVYSLKKLLKGIKVKNYDCRQDGSKISGPKERWLFNSTISGIDESDGCLLIGTNPRKEAPLLNSRILRQSRITSYPLGLIGTKCDLTYDYEILGEDPKIVQEILEGKNSFCDKLKLTEKPVMIVGQGALTGDKGSEFLDLCIELAYKFNFINNEWNGFNVLHTAASRAGAMSIDFIPEEDGKNTEEIINGCKEGLIKTIFLLGADELQLSDLDNCYVIYQGHHGDKGANNADLILPSAAFCEQNGLYMNTEGRVQESVRSVFPVGEAKEDWEIIRLISEALNLNSDFQTHEELRNKIYKEYPNLDPFNDFQRNTLPEKKDGNDISGHKFSEAITNYWFTNSIARASLNLSDRNNFTQKRDN